jgi:hypothetical protein
MPCTCQEAWRERKYYVVSHNRRVLESCTWSGDNQKAKAPQRLLQVGTSIYSGKHRSSEDKVQALHDMYPRQQQHAEEDIARREKVGGAILTFVDYRDIPIYITSFNNLDRGLRQLLAWLRRAGMTSIGILDNNSSWPPLLEFFNSPAMDGIQLLHAGANLGPDAFWRLDLHLRQTGPFIVTDPDCVPDDDCPLDLVRKMLEVSERYAPAKVGPALRIDDLPEHYALRDHMRLCESDYWVRKYDAGDCWNAAIDTTAAIYQPGWEKWPLASQGGVAHVRLDFPYVLRHVPWYEDSANLSAEARYYMAHVENGYSSSCPQPIPMEQA